MVHAVTGDQNNIEKNYYLLMHRNDMVALIMMDDYSGQIVKLVKVLDGNLLPIGMDEESGKCELELKNWWRERAIPISRDGINRVLGKFGYVDTTCLLLAAHGLCLTDNYWINNVNDSQYTWENINFYDNDFSSDLGDLFVDNIIREGVDVSPFVPSSSVIGEMKKKWIIENGIRKLVKINKNDSRQQTANELIASALHKQLGWNNYVIYESTEVQLSNEKVEACKCANFTDKDCEFVSAHQLMCNSKKPNELSNYEYLIQSAVSLGCDEGQVRKQLEYQMMTDFLLTNTDRHWNNFGFIKMSNQSTLCRMAPIYDTGNSLFFQEAHIPVDDNLLDIQITSFTEKEVEQLKYINHSEWVEMDLLDGFEYTIRDILSEHSMVPDQKIENIIKSFLKKKEYLTEFQNGKKIWKTRKYW